MNKTKKMSKAFAALLAVLIIACMMPLTVLAATGDVTAVVIKGDTVPVTPVATVAEARTKTVEVALTPAQLADTTTAFATTEEGGASEAIVMLIAGGNDVAIAAATDIVDGSKPDAKALTPGDVIWVKDKNGNMVRILINQKAGGTIPGESVVKNAIINVVLPTNIDFAVNPLQLGTVTGDSQVTSTDYRVTNKSDAPVRVSFDITATLGSGVTLVSSKSELTPDQLTGADKDVYFAALGAKSFKDTTVPTWADPTLGTYVYDSAEAGTLSVFDPDTSKAEISFLLGAATGTPLDALAADEAGVASFQFYAELNTYAGWLANDISVSGAYTLTGIKTTDYDKVDNLVGVNQMSNSSTVADPENDVKVAAGETGTLTTSRATWNPTKVFLSDKPASITSVALGAATFTATTDYTYDASTGILTITRVPGGTASTMTATIVAGGGTYKVDITFS